MQEGLSQNHQSLYEQGYTLYTNENYIKAEEIFQVLLVQEPRIKEYWQGYAACLQMQAKYQHSLFAWSMALLLNEKDPLPHLHAAECLFSLGEISQGKQALIAAENRDAEKKYEEQISLLRETWESYRG